MQLQHIRRPFFAAYRVERVPHMYIIYIRVCSQQFFTKLSKNFFTVVFRQMVAYNAQIFLRIIREEQLFKKTTNCPLLLPIIRLLYVFCIITIQQCNSNVLCLTDKQNQPRLVFVFFSLWEEGGEVHTVNQYEAKWFNIMHC